MDCFSRGGCQLDDPHVPASNKYFFLSRTYLKLEFISDVDLLRGVARGGSQGFRNPLSRQGTPPPPIFNSDFIPARV